MSPGLWNTGHRSGRVSIGTHCLHLKAAGPDRHSGQVAVIIIQGLASTASAWATVQRLVSDSFRVYSYDRSGFGESDPSTYPPTSQNIATELKDLLKRADIAPPYVLVAHSWGGILSREFVALCKEGDIAGVVFIESNQERTLEILDWRPLSMWAMDSGIDFFETTGLNKNHQMTDLEWKNFREDMNDEKNEKQVAAEWAEYAESFGVLAAKHQLHRTPPLLRDVPVSIIRGKNVEYLRKMYDAVVEKGHGSDEERARFKDFLDTFDEKDYELQSELRSLSGTSRYVEALQSGHDVQFTEPGLIVEQVEWVAQTYFGRREH